METSSNTLSYRPRNAGHDYYGRGTYLITLVVSGRERLLSGFASGGVASEGVATENVATENGRKGEDGYRGEENGRKGEGGYKSEGGFSGGATENGRKGTLVLTSLGEVVQEAWRQIPVRSQVHGNKVVVHACVCMPDHFHGVIEVLEPMEWNLGDVIQAFKAFCTSWWQRQQGLPSSVNRQISADCRGEGAPAWLREKAALNDNEGDLIRSMSKKQRQEYYTFVGRQQRPLFDDNYDDTVCLDERHRQAMIAYVNDNPRRALLRRLLPDFLRRCLHIRMCNLATA